MQVENSERTRMGARHRGKDAGLYRGESGSRGERQQSDSRVAHAATACAATNPSHRNGAEVGLRAPRWRRRYAAVRMELVRERKRTERLLQRQREQDTKGSSPARWRGAGGGGVGSSKVQGGESASEGGEVTLNPNGRAIPEWGIRASPNYAHCMKARHDRILSYHDTLIPNTLLASWQSLLTCFLGDPRGETVVRGVFGVRHGEIRGLYLVRADCAW